MEPTNLKNGKRVAVTHGELIFVPIDGLAGSESIKTKNYIAGHSETSHHHILESTVEFDVVEGAERQILLREIGKLWHQKTFDIHETQILAPGAYKIIQKTEYNPFTKALQNIFD